MPRPEPSQNERQTDWFVLACPCGYYDVGDERICPECGVGMLARIEVEPIEPLPWTPEQSILNSATAEGLFEVGEDGKYHLTEKGRRVAEPEDDDG